MGKAWHFLKNYISIDREKYVFLLPFALKMRDYEGFSWPTKRNHIINDIF